MADEAYTGEPATRVFLDSGQYVRVGETIGEVSDLIAAAETDKGYGGFIPVEDPGDGRPKLIRAARVIWIEEEAADA